MIIITKRSYLIKRLVKEIKNGLNFFSPFYLVQDTLTYQKSLHIAWQFVWLREPIYVNYAFVFGLTGEY